MPAMPRLALLALMLLPAAVPPAQAQQRVEPFETVEVRLGGMSNVNRNFLHAFWKPGAGAEAAIATPFYLGFVEVGGAFHRYEAGPASVPAFDAVLLYAGWGLRLDVADRLRLEGGGRIGDYRMSFDEVTFAGVRNENELALLLQARLALRPAGPVSVYVAGSYMKVYTFVRLNLWYVSAGLSYRLRSPGWLKDLLR